MQQQILTTETIDLIKKGSPSFAAYAFAAAASYHAWHFSESNAAYVNQDIHDVACAIDRHDGDRVFAIMCSWKTFEACTKNPDGFGGFDDTTTSRFARIAADSLRKVMLENNLK